jgi:hypothetical protein
MKKLFMWVDRNNFKLFARGKGFTGWSNESTVDCIQISVPPSAIITMEEKEEGIYFKCYEEENWL